MTESLARMSAGRWFEALGPATANDRAPKCVTVGLTTSTCTGRSSLYLHIVISLPGVICCGLSGCRRLLWRILRTMLSAWWLLSARRKVSSWCWTKRITSTTVWTCCSSRSSKCVFNSSSKAQAPTASTCCPTCCPTNAQTLKLNYFPHLDYSVSLVIAEDGGSPRATRATFFSGIMYLVKHLIYTICSSHRNDHRTSSIDCDLQKLMNIIVCELKNLKDLLSLSPLIIINNILSDFLSIIAFYLTFYVAFLLHRIHISQGSVAT